MTDVESGRARELVGRVGRQAPPMPGFSSIAAQASLQDDAAGTEVRSATLGGRLVVGAAMAAFVVAGISFWWLAQGQDSEQIITDQGNPPATAELNKDPALSTNPPPSGVAIWTNESWPMLAGPGDFEVRSALRHSNLARSVSFSGPEGLVATIDVFAEGGFGFVSGPVANEIEIEINGAPGWVEISGGTESQPSTSLSWQRDDFQFTMRVKGSLGPDEAVALAETVVPTAEEDLPATVVSAIGLGAGEPFEVATATTSSGTIALQVSTADGFLFFMQHPGSEGGPRNLMTLDRLVDVIVESGPNYRANLITGRIYGLVNQSVASLSLRLTDGSTEEVEIQSRSLGYEAAFVFTIVDDFGAVAALEAFDENQTLLESIDLSRWVPSSIGPARPVVIKGLETSVEQFVTGTLGWELTEGAIQEVDPGAVFVITDSATQTKLRVTIRADGAGIASVAPDNSNLAVALELSETSVTLNIDGPDSDASSATLFVATRRAEIQRTLTKQQLAEGSITVDIRGLSDETSFGYLLLFKDEAGRVISALSAG